MSFETCIKTSAAVLMEGALGERLKREYGLNFDEKVAMAKLIYEEKGALALRGLWGEYMDIARRYGMPFLATTPTRRVNVERAADDEELKKLIFDNVSFLREVERESGVEMYVGGLMGCKGDAYTGEGALAEEEAVIFHSRSARYFAEAGADFLYAGIMPTLGEAAGMARAMERAGVPYIISFTIQADGTLIDGTPIARAIEYIDGVTERKPVCYMTNCVHPSILFKALSAPVNDTPVVRERFRGIQANTSPLSYAELDGCADLKCSEPEEFAREMIKLTAIGDFKIWGGCCGTDNRHMEQVAMRLKKAYLDVGLQSL